MKLEWEWEFYLLGQYFDYLTLQTQKYIGENFVFQNIFYFNIQYKEQSFFNIGAGEEVIVQRAWQASLNVGPWLYTKQWIKVGK